MQRLSTMTGIISTVVSTYVASAQVTAVGPFTGDQSENFEDDNRTVSQQCLDVGFGRAFNDTADICTLGPRGHGIIEVISWSFSCTIFPHGGSWFMGTSSDFATVIFDQPVTAFGGYFGSNAFEPNENANAIANFYDDAGNLIDSVDMDITNDCSWTWNGWETQGTAIKSIELVNGAFLGAFLQMDDMEYIAGEISDCLTMRVSPIVAGEFATWEISGATPGSRVVVVNGFEEGSTILADEFGFCATFGIADVEMRRVVGKAIADGDGYVSIERHVLKNLSGLKVLTQAAQSGTCPDECVSGVDMQVVR